MFQSILSWIILVLIATLSGNICRNIGDLRSSGYSMFELDYRAGSICGRRSDGRLGCRSMYTFYWR